MAAYVTVEDLETKVTFPAKPYDDTTTPTRTAVEGHIEDIAAQINGVLRGAGYVLPLSGEDDLKYLRMLNGWGAGSLAREGVSTVHNGDVGATAEDLWEKYTTELVKIEKSKIALEGAKSTGLPRSLTTTFATDGSDPDISNIQPLFRRDTVF